MSPPHSHTDQLELASEHLKRSVVVEVFLPLGYAQSPSEEYRVLYLLDGQDAPALGLRETLDGLHWQRRIQPLIVVGVHCGPERLLEYGTAGVPDYKGRGRKAKAHKFFLLYELMPYIQRNYRVHAGPDCTAIAGFSLGGLAALDTAWAHPDVFGQVGVFSGSLWWRFKGLGQGYQDADRIMHNLIRYSDGKPPLRFWFEAGTNDETSDRNQNGIIDAIEDTLDLIDELVLKGYDPIADIHYLEIVGGEHNPHTWGRAMPEFLKWAFPSRK